MHSFPSRALAEILSRLIVFKIRHILPFSLLGFLRHAGCEGNNSGAAAEPSWK